MRTPLLVIGFFAIVLAFFLVCFKLLSMIVPASPIGGAVERIGLVAFMTTSIVAILGTLCFILIEDESQEA